MSDERFQRMTALVDKNEIRNVKAAAALIGERVMIFVGRAAGEEAARILRVSEQRKPGERR